MNIFQYKLYHGKLLTLSDSHLAICSFTCSISFNNQKPEIDVSYFRGNKNLKSVDPFAPLGRVSQEGVLVPFKNWLVFPCSLLFRSARPYPHPLDSRLGFCFKISHSLIDTFYFAIFLAATISDSKCFSYPRNQLAKLLVAFTTDYNFK